MVPDSSSRSLPRLAFSSIPSLDPDSTKEPRDESSNVSVSIPSTVPIKLPSSDPSWGTNWLTSAAYIYTVKSSDAYVSYST